MNSFEGFTPAGLQLLNALPSFDRDAFQAARPRYESQILEPAKLFVVAVGELLHERISPELRAEPKTNGSLSPINNDLRFNPDRAPYKDHLMFNFWEGTPKKTAPTLRIRLTSTKVGFATGAAFDKAGLVAWRDALGDDRGAAFADLSAELATATRADVAGGALKTVPAPYPQDHPRADLLKFKGYQLRWQEDLTAAVGTPELADWCVDRLEQPAAVHRWLVDLLV
jgi:uncharacterized protein (TIGR02453 family)